MPLDVVGYYLWPPFWVGEPPPPSFPDPQIIIDVQDLEREVYSKSLQAGISVSVLRGGLFKFDLSNWPPGRSDDSCLPGSVESYRFWRNRIMLMNAHLACLHSALWENQHLGSRKMVVSPWDVIQLQSLAGFVGGGSEVWQMQLV